MNRRTVPALWVILAAVVYLVPPGLTQRSWAGEAQTPMATSVSAPPSGPIVFEMKYRGLGGADDPLRYPSYASFGTPQDGSDQKDLFVQAVKSLVRECTPVFFLPRRRWSVVELQDRKPVAFYFDVNADGKLSGEEKFPAVTGAALGLPYVFITSDFMIEGQRRRAVPYRAMLAVNPMGPEQYLYLWSPHCVLEGQATLAGEIKGELAVTIE